MNEFAVNPAKPSSEEEHIEALDNGLRHLVLNVKNVGHLAVVTLRPEIVAIGHADQLRRHADAIPCPAHTSFDNSRDTQHFAGLANIHLFAAEREGRHARRHPQTGHMSQRVNDFLSQAITEIFVFFIRAQIRKRQHGD